MKLRIGILLMAVLLLLGACKRKGQHQFTHDFLLPMTPVKDQGKSELCWAYAMLDTIETEHILVLPDDATEDLPTPQWVFMLGAKYTPQEFAHSVCAPDEYLALTCWPDSPYYKKVEIDVPDNWEHNRLLNLPLDTLRKHVDHALRNRHPVCWESRGHAMAIVGVARDEQGKPYYVMKNSWGTDRPYGGLVYMSVRKMWKDMIAVYMTREAFAPLSVSPEGE